MRAVALRREPCADYAGRRRRRLWHCVELRQPDVALGHQRELAAVQCWLAHVAPRFTAREWAHVHAVIVVVLVGISGGGSLNIFAPSG